MRDAYASYEQYIAVRQALQNLQISTDTLNSLIVLDKEATIAEDVCEALQSGGKKCAYIIPDAKELFSRLKARLLQNIGWLGRRQFFEFRCLCEFGDNLMNRDDFLYECEVEEIIEALDRYDPSVAVDTDGLYESNAYFLVLQEVVDFIEDRHEICKNYRKYLEEGHAEDEEPLREERLEEEDNEQDN